MRFCSLVGFGLLDVPHEHERHAHARAGCRGPRRRCGPAPGRRRAGPRRCAASPVSKTCSGILRLVSNVLPGQRDAPAPAPHLELERAVGAGQHDEPALGPGHLDGRVDHHRQHFVEHAARAQGPQALEQRRDLAQVARRRRGRALGRSRRRVVETEHHLAFAARPHLDHVVVPQRVLGDLRSPFTNVPNRDPLSRSTNGLALPRDVRVVTRHVGAGQAHVAFDLAANRRRVADHRERPRTGRVRDLEPSLLHRRPRFHRRQASTMAARPPIIHDNSRGTCA